MTLLLLAIVVFTLAYAMVAKRMATTMLTAPMVFLAYGAALSQSGLMVHSQAEALLHVVAELALIILLFLDAAQIDLRALRQQHIWPVRMLLIGLPLSVVLGALAAWPFLSDWPLVAIVLVAAILAPTDAALGQAVVTNPIVPDRARRALTVESGLNDGLALPVILLFASLTASAVPGATTWALFAAKQLILGPAVGLVIGVVGGVVLLWAKAAETTSEAFEGVGAIAMAGAAYLAAIAVGGNGFISAFVAGLAFGHIIQGQCKFVYEFTEGDGHLLSWGAFLLIGMVLVPEAIKHLTLATLGLILVSLVVVRPAAIWLSLIGTDASAPSRLFFGWFGPRGLATALFALLVVGQIDHPYAEPILAIAINAVWISAVLHGLSALPGARLYAARVADMGDCAERMPAKVSAKPLVTR
ncbi:MAG: cation:proton antiporter [Pseudomonadota bacterium]